MERPDRTAQDRAEIDRAIAEITAGARDDNETLRAFARAFEQDAGVPFDGFVMGEPVSVHAFEYDGNPRRGLTVRCRRENGAEHIVAALDLAAPRNWSGARCLGAYRAWSGLDPFPPDDGAGVLPRRRHKAAAGDLDLHGPLELIVLSGAERTARCRVPASDRLITLRASGLWQAVPGEIVAVKPRKQWKYGGHPYLSGEVESMRLDVPALGLTPLALHDKGTWDPWKHYWGEKDERIEEWAEPIIARGPRPEFEMEQVLPGSNWDDFDSCPIGDANDLKDAGDFAGARKLLMKLCEADLRCLDAHAHLGNYAFSPSPKVAIRHYEVGLRIGELSLGPDFDAVLPWGWLDNRPFLRCMHGFGLCLWRLRRFQEAERIFERMLWLNPTDNQGARFLLDDVRAQLSWEDCQDDEEV